MAKTFVAGVDVTDLTVGSNPTRTVVAGVDVTDITSSLPNRLRTHPKPSLVEEFGRGVGVGIDQLQIAALANVDLIAPHGGGLESFIRGQIDEQNRQSQDAPPTIQSLEQIENPGDFFRWAAGGLGQLAPSMAVAIGSGGLGGLFARKGLEATLRRQLRKEVVEDLTKKGFTEELAKEQLESYVDDLMRQEYVQNLLFEASKKGAAKKLFMSSVAQNTGETQSELIERGIESPFTASIAGLVSGALDAAPQVALLEKLFPGVDKQLAKSFVVDLAKTVGKQGLMEGSTEGAQEFITLAAAAYHDPSIDITSPENTARMLNAAALGAIGGIVAGGGGSVITSAADYAVKRAEEMRQQYEFEKNLNGMRAGAQQSADFVSDAFGNVRRPGEEPPPDAPTPPGGESAAPSPAGSESATVTEKPDELRDAALKAVRDVFTPLFQRMRAAVVSGLDAVGKDTGGKVTPGTLATAEQILRLAESEAQERALPELQKIAAELEVRLREAEAQLAGATDPAQREQLRAFIISAMNEWLEKQRDQRIAPIIQEAEDRAQSSAEVRDFDQNELEDYAPDPDEEPDDYDPEAPAAVDGESRLSLRRGPSGRPFWRVTEPLDPEEGPEPTAREDQLQKGISSLDTRHLYSGIFGRVIKTSTRDGRKVLTQSTGDEAVGWTQEAEARNALRRIRQRYAAESEGSWDVVQLPDPNSENKSRWFVVHMDATRSEAYRELHLLNTHVEHARMNSRGNDNPRRKIRIIRPDAKINPKTGKPEGTWVDLPTLVEAGRKLIQQTEEEATDNAERLVAGLSTILGRLLDAGYQIEGLDLSSEAKWGKLGQKIVYQKNGITLLADQLEIVRPPEEKNPSEKRAGGDKAEAFAWKRAWADALTELKRASGGKYVPDTEIVKRANEIFEERERKRSLLFEMQNIHRKREETPAFDRGADPDFAGVSQIKEDPAAARAAPSLHQRITALIDEARNKEAIPDNLFNEARARAKEEDQLLAKALGWRNQSVAQSVRRAREIFESSIGRAEEEFGKNLDEYLKKVGERIEEARNEKQPPPETKTSPLEDVTDNDLAERLDSVKNPRDRMGYEADRFDRRGIPTEADANEESLKGRPIGSQTVGERDRVRVYVADEEIASRIETLVNDLTKLLNLRNRVTVVDEAGAAQLIRIQHPLAAQLQQALDDRPLGRIIMLGEDAVIFLRDDMLIDPNTGDLESSGVRTVRVLGHEIGHLFFSTYFDTLTPALKRRLHSAHKKSAPDQDFEEWAADQLVAWASHPRSKAKNAVESFFKRVSQKLRQIFDFLRGRYNLDETYAQFIEGVVGAQSSARDSVLNAFGQHFRNEGVVGYRWFEKDVARDLEAIEDNSTPTMRRRVRSQLNRLRQGIESSSGLLDTVNYIHENLFASLAGRIRRIPGGQRFADAIHRVRGEARDAPHYFDAKRLQLAVWQTKFANAIKAIPADQQREVARELLSKDGTDEPHTNPHAIKIRALLDEFFQYLREAGVPIKQQKNYFTRQLDPNANIEGVAELLIAKGWSNENARNWIGRVFGPQIRAGNNPDFVEFEDVVPGVSDPHIKIREVLKGNEWLPFLDHDLNRLMARYITQGVHLAEYNRYFGGDAVPDASQRGGWRWNKSERFDAMKDEMRRAGATEADLRFARQALDAVTGRIGRNLPDSVRSTMAWVVTYQNMRVLLFATLASFPDLIGPAIRTGDFKHSWGIFRKSFAEAVNKESDLNEMGRAWGIISDTMNHYVISDFLENHWLTPTQQKINDRWFKAIGLHAWTNFTRAASLAIGIDFIKTRAARALNGDQKAMHQLNELGLTPSDVATWVRNHEQAWGSVNYQQTDPEAVRADKKVAEAMVQFVNESVMNPNAAQRPLWMSNPAFMLLSHLRAYIYALQDTIVSQIIQNARDGGTPAAKAWAVAVPAAFMLLLTAFGLELRELLQYKLWGRKARTDSMDGPEYIMELIERSGLLGASQLAVDFDRAGEHGQIPLLGLLGPTATQFSEAVTKPVSQTLPSAVPIASQVPPLRDMLRTPLR